MSSSSKRSSPSSTAPKALPSNFDEVVQRLISLEGSFRGLSDTASQQYTLSSEHTSLLRDSSKRLAGLEADFEAERRRSTKARDTNEKSRVAETEKLESTLKGIRNKLDSLNEAIKSHEAERKTGSVELSRLRSDLVKVYKDMDAHKGRLEMLVGKTDAALDRQRTVKVVREAIEDILPSRLAVNIDPKTGQVAVDPTFWRYLQSHFSSGGSGGAGSRGSVSWEDFVNSNSDKLRKMVNAEVDGHVTREVREGAILSKKTFAEALERELQALSQRISQSTSEQMAHLSSEVEGKLTKLSKSTGDSHKSIKLSSGQDVNALVSSMIEEALSRYSKDVLAKPDFALYTAGGRVIPSLTSPSYEIRPSSLTGSFLARLTGSGVVRGKAPVTALHPDISTGQCWAIGGTSGQLGVLLSRRIYPSDITVEHASKEVALDVSSAPKEFEAWGIVADPSDLKSIQGEEMRLVEGDDKIGNMIRLVQAAYDVEATNNIQTFEVDEKIKDLRIPISAVVFKILSNHGNEHLSCLYRVRVGGEVAEGR